jgi:cytochrome b subunit of formate dehydrogenase
MARHGQTAAILVLFFILLIFCGSASAANLKMQCTDCHSDDKFKAGHRASVHGSIGCTGCHARFESLDRHVIAKEKPPLIACGTCHKEIEKQYSKSFHYIYEDFRCYDCHYDIHVLKRQKEGFKIAVTNNCTKCHTNDEYTLSGHGAAVMKGNQDSATCSDCHGLHDTKAYHTSGELYVLEAREFYNKACKACHSGRQMMKRNNITPDAVKYYEETYHGKVQDLGYATSVAGCADCHTTHNILPAANPASAINPRNLTRNCGKCHHRIHPRFAEYKAHPDYRDRKRYPALYASFLAMEALLLVTFGFFWIHTFLWWRKIYWEKHRMQELGVWLESPFTYREGLQEIQRFPVKDRIMHLLLILSFFCLAITGFPIKYHSTPWARAIINAFGGAHNAGIAHRIAALVLIGLFLYALWRCLRFTFPKGWRKKGWRGAVSRLLGPDSMLPNGQDWRQFKAMVRWFFGKGDLPDFDRWVYWEKFDFLAIFWGMIAIGGSGVTLWAPELASYIYPGWVFNIASIVHSEEALLAAVFIFTVHFFNTHLIPTKFPMDNVIFTGSHKLGELWRFRRLEYERLLRQGKLDERKVGHPSIPLKLTAALVGHASLLLGLIFILILLWTFFFG